MGKQHAAHKFLVEDRGRFAEGQDPLVVQALQLGRHGG